MDPGDPREIADSIEYLLSHPIESAEMGRRGRWAIEKKYNWDYEKRKLLALYSSVLKM